MADTRAPFAARGVLTVAGLLSLLLLVFATRYGYHRDELYFVMLGGHPSFGYVDQPPLVPLLAHGLDAASGHSLFWLRVPAALAASAAVVLVAAIAREVGARTSGQVFAAAAWALSAVVLDAGHLTSTTVFDLLDWSVVTWLVLRALRVGGRAWVWPGVAVGVALEVKTLAVFLVFGLVLGFVVAGPREVFRERWLWVGAGLAVVLWLPDLLWQATHGWPQLTLSKSIASGGSDSSQPRALFVPFQLVQLSPVLVPSWAYGWWRLARSPDLRRFRAFAMSFVGLALVFFATGGKPYYLVGVFPILIGAGAQWFVDLVRRGWLCAILALGLVINVLLFVPIVPRSAIAGTPITAIDPDAGETVGWHGFVATIRGAWDGLPGRDHAAVLTENYGEAGSIHRFAPDLPVFSGDNSLRSLGRPPDDTTTVVLVGYDHDRLTQLFGSLVQVATTPTPYGIDDDEADEPVWVGTRPLAPWSVIFSRLEKTG